MILNRTHLQLKVMQLEKYDWSFENERRFSNFFLFCLSTFSPHMQEGFDKRCVEFEKKWYGFSIEKAEYIIYAMTHWDLGKKAVVRIRIPKDDPANPRRYLYDWVEKRQIDWEGMENDLKDLALWCMHQVSWLCKQNDVDFTEMDVSVFGLK